jgi:hypothetical protein
MRRYSYNRLYWWVLGGSGEYVKLGASVGKSGGASVVTCASVTVTPVTVIASVSVTAGIDASVGDWLPHAERIVIASIKKVVISFPFIVNLL